MLHPSSALLTLAASIWGEWHTARWFHDTHLGHTPVHSALATHCASVTPSSPPYSPRSFQEHQPTSHWERCTNLWAVSCVSALTHPSPQQHVTVRGPMCDPQTRPLPAHKRTPRAQRRQRRDCTACTSLRGDPMSDGTYVCWVGLATVGHAGDKAHFLHTPAARAVHGGWCHARMRCHTLTRSCRVHSSSCGSASSDRRGHCAGGGSGTAPAAGSLTCHSRAGRHRLGWVHPRSHPQCHRPCDLSRLGCSTAAALQDDDTTERRVRYPCPLLHTPIAHLSLESMPHAAAQEGRVCQPRRCLAHRPSLQQPHHHTECSSQHGHRGPVAASLSAGTLTRTARGW